MIEGYQIVRINRRICIRQFHAMFESTDREFGEIDRDRSAAIQVLTLAGG